MKHLKHFIAAIAIGTATAACAQADPAAVQSKLEALAKAGNAEALYHLGMFYQVGTGGMAVDLRRELVYFRQAAERGDPLGAYKLGCFYAGQDGVIEADQAKALEYKLIAAKAGYALAQQDVAAIYAERGDYALAKEWLAKAAAQGVVSGLVAYASIHIGAPGITPDAAITDAYFGLALDRMTGSDEQRTWLAEFESRMSAADRARAGRIKAEFRPQPSPLTLKALSGASATAALAAGK